MLIETSYIQVMYWVELPVQRRLCLIFVRNVGSPDIHECFRGLTGSQRTPGIWGVTAEVLAKAEKYINGEEALISKKERSSTHKERSRTDKQQGRSPKRQRNRERYPKKDRERSLKSRASIRDRFGPPQPELR